jgi:hypothetical protein
MTHYDITFTNGDKVHFSEPAFGKTADDVGISFDKAEEKFFIPWSSVLIIREWDE